jgi:transaldolase
VLEDIHSALDVFEPLYQESNGNDGYVSVEVDPALAHDSAGTLTNARELDNKISRPNVMIKIPATSECISAIETMISEGRNVNALSRGDECIFAWLRSIIKDGSK